MSKCVAALDGRDIRGQVIKCGEECEPGYKYCPKHKERPRAIKDREDKSIGNIVDAADIFAGEPTRAREDNKAPEPEENGSSVATRPKTGMPTVNKAYEVAQRCFEMLDRAVAFESDAYDRMSALPKEQWRYTDKAGAEQLRSEISVYERSLDRTLRAVTAVAKLNIDAQAVNINKVVREMIKGVVMRVFQRMELDQQQIDQARRYLAEEFEKVSKDD